MSDLLVAAWTYAAEHPAQLGDAMRRHLTLSAAALALALAISLPLGLAAARRLPGAEAGIQLVNGLRVVPSIAILFIAIPWLGIGYQPALLALVVLACPPIVLATATAFRGVGEAILEAARAMGMSPREVLWRVEVPLAAPVVASGMRTAAVEVVASATLAAFIGAGGLGDFITLGFQLNRAEIMLVGAVPVALLALLSEAFFGVADRRLTPWRA